MEHRNKNIWSQDCIAICTLLGFTLDDQQIHKLCSKYDLHSDEEEVDTFYGFYLLHKACHKKGGALPKRITKLLNERYAGIIRIVRKATCSNDMKFGGNTEIVTKLKSWIGKAPEGVIWALLTDPRKPLQHHGVYLIHQISYTAFRDARRKNMAEEQDADALDIAQRKLWQSQKRLLQQKTDVENFRKKLTETEQCVAALQITCDRQQQQISEFEKRPGREKQLNRRIRMLEHELAQIHSKKDIHSEKTDHQPEKSEVTYHSCVADESPSDELEATENADCHPCSLDNLRIAVIGGLDRLEPHYRRVVENLGAQFCFHNGDCHGGCQILKNIVCQSDIILFFTRVNSYSALQVARGLCRKTGKRFTAIRGASPKRSQRHCPEP